MTTYFAIDDQSVQTETEAIYITAARPQDGRGAGRDVQGGRGQNRNKKPCKSGPGKSQGGGRGKGKNR